MPEPSTSGAVRYDRSPQEWRRCLDDDQRAAEARTWLRSDTLDAWRHNRMRAMLDPFLGAEPRASWLTVGDGRFGTDAHYFHERGIAVHATDVDDTLLRIGAEQGFIGSFGAENAEALSFADGSFDYVFCKESFHHFPRPWIALYEMLRVARKGVVLIEPGDPLIGRATGGGLGRLIDTLKRGIRKLMGKPGRQDHSFEPLGNYVFTLSPWECQKVLLGLHLRHLAWKGLNDFYIKGAEFCPISGGTPADAHLRRRLFSGLRRRDAISRLTGTWGLNVIVLMKEAPPAPLQTSLRSHGWSIKELPPNPYL